jgi:hypothetical protein
LYCAWPNDLADDFRSRVVETDVVAHLFALLEVEGQDSVIQQSFVDAITALAKFGGFLYHFVLCED